MNAREAKIREPIITSILDNDLYKLTMGSVVFHMFPRARVTYEFINRGKNPFPEGFAKAINWQIELLSTMSLTYEERLYLSGIPYLRPTYIEWLAGYQYDPSEVVVQE
jgi:nicotinate phosphoribosyltransferase